MGIRDFASRLFGGAKGTDAPKNQMLLSDGTRGSELYSILTGNGIDTMAISERSALSTSAVYASVGLIGGAVASMPFHLYKRTAAGRDRYESDLWWLFNESPHPAWTSASAWQYTMQSILLKGDSFWIIQRASRLSPKIVGFMPVHPDFVHVHQDSDKRNLYTVTYGGESVVYEQDDILHFAGLGFNGLRSLTPISYALRYAAGTTLAADEYAGGFFKGGARPDHALEVPSDVRLSPEQREQLKESWGKQRSGYHSAGATPVLTGGIKVVPLTLNAEDAQLLQTRQFGVEEIARIFGVPPHMIGKTDASTSWGSGIEQMSIGFVRYTLRRHLDIIQQEINRKLWPRSLQVFGEFNTDALLDGDSKAQADYFTKALGGPGTQGWMTINEVRKLKNLPPVAEGDKIVQSGAAQQSDPQQAQAMAELNRRIEAAEKPQQPIINVQPTINVDNKLPEQAAPVVNVAAPAVDVHVPEQAAPVVNNTVNVPELVAQFEATVNVEKPEPAQVHIAPQVINVAPTPVEVVLPKRKTETMIERDSNGNITHATQIEEDA